MLQEFISLFRDVFVSKLPKFCKEYEMPHPDEDHEQ